MDIFLDDLRPCPKGFTWIKNVDYLIHEFKCRRDSKLKINILSLDHDLGENELTGYDFCKWLVEEGYDNPEIYPNIIYLHTDNGVGRDNMYQLLSRYKPDWVELYRYPMPTRKERY